MKKLFYFACFLLLSFSISQAQIIRCATYELHKQRMENDAQYRAYYANIGQQMHAWQTQSAQERTSGLGTIVIPVVVHVLWNTAEQNISDAQILSEITVLNEDYSGNNGNRTQVPTGFQSRFGNGNINFCMATRTPAGDWTTGIERKQTSTTSYNYGDPTIKDANSGGLNAWDRSKYLNIWVVNLSCCLLGYTEMPGGPANTDGTVILYSAFGRGTGPLIAHYNLGRTATHEIGHWLGLFHVWGDDGCACSGPDYIDDTPNQACCTYGSPAFPVIDGCAHFKDDDSIPGDPVNGIMFMNYLDYSDDASMSMFTVDQVAVMRGYFNAGQFRASILTSNGCATPNGIAEINAATYIDLYPNPANNIVNINFRLPTATVLTVTAFDMLGKKLMTSEVHKTGEQNINLDVSSLQAGLYMLVVNTDQGNIAKHFAITR